MIKKLENILDKFAVYGLVISLSFMLGLTLLNIVLRWFETTYMWIDPLVRHLVFLSAFLGGVLATSKENHIRIDLAPKLLERFDHPALKKGIERLILLVCVVATILLCKAGYDFMLVELEYGKEAFLGLHSGYLVGIIPFGMMLIALRFILKFFASFKKV